MSLSAFSYCFSPNNIKPICSKHHKKKFTVCLPTYCHISLHDFILLFRKTHDSLIRYLLRDFETIHNAVRIECRMQLNTVHNSHKMLIGNQCRYRIKTGNSKLLSHCVHLKHYWLLILYGLRKPLQGGFAGEH